MLENQNHSCAICNKHEDEFPRRFAIDHNHTTGEVRGLLCTNCNANIIQNREDSVILRRAADYLDNFRTGWFVPEEYKEGKPR